jgi:hypothetical protein
VPATGLPGLEVLWHSAANISKLNRTFQMVIKMKRQRGGARPGAGRPAGHRNKKTVEREIALKGALDDTVARLTKEEIERFSPLEVLLLVMRLQLQAGNLSGALAAADRASPYVHARLSSNIPPPVLPEDLEPDPPAVGDEPGPENPVL